MERLTIRCLCGNWAWACLAPYLNAEDGIYQCSLCREEEEQQEQDSPEESE